jgi:rhamnosyl/mannosyltransferase
VVGDGPARVAIQKELPSDAVVRFLGAVSDQEKQALIARCAALVLPSINRAEAFGLVLLEAAMQAKPQISTHIGTATSWVNLDGETGWVVPPSNVSALAAAMQEVVAQPVLAQERGLQSLKRWQQLFQGSIMVAAYEQLYGDLLKSQSTSSKSSDHNPERFERN